LIIRLANPGGVLDRCREGIDDDIGRKDYIAVLIQHVATVAGHGALLASARDESQLSIRASGKNKLIEHRLALLDKAFGVIDCLRASEPKYNSRQRRVRIREIEIDLHLERPEAAKLRRSRKVHQFKQQRNH
jgi:hypothetical protein